MKSPSKRGLNDDSTEGADIAVELIDVEKSFDGQAVHKGVNLQVPTGKTTVITGGSGQGKSVILKMMLGLIRPDRGQVLVFGQDMAKANRKQMRALREQFGVLFQSVALFDSMTIFDNVALLLRERTTASEQEIRQRVNEKLAMMDLEGVNDKFPAQLSGGMVKRAGLARALILEPQIVFFDEPTTGLDAKRSSEIYRVFHRTQLQFGYTAVIVSHDIPKIFKLSDQVALLADGIVQGAMSPQAFQRSSVPAIQSFVADTMGPIYLSEFEESGIHETV